eukprot:CAMPEP_0174250702 /NCGR_PEP_ID=MMETSP0439-20130205/788_1 /TAXON_ID=0 /ORGANISM="Stereomyxa ramosa, Strain Chinc5" /LENGTH=328 /DNA_ID=CAMNT_0015330839 /DNA_START=702 /DNA_END=1685 /DNA_ORIENTATION=-
MNHLEVCAQKAEDNSVGIRAIEQGLEVACKEMLVEAYDLMMSFPFSSNISPFTRLVCALRGGGHIPMIEYILSTTGESLAGKELVDEAVKYASIETVMYLLSKGATIDSEDVVQIVSAAFYREDAETAYSMAELLLKHFEEEFRASPDPTVFIFQCPHIVDGQERFVKLAVDYGCDINADPNPFHCAISSRNFKMAEALLSQGADKKKCMEEPKILPLSYDRRYGWSDYVSLDEPKEERKRKRAPERKEKKSVARKAKKPLTERKKQELELENTLKEKGVFKADEKIGVFEVKWALRKEKVKTRATNKLDMMKQLLEIVRKKNENNEE